MVHEGPVALLPRDVAHRALEVRDGTGEHGALPGRVAELLRRLARLRGSVAALLRRLEVERGAAGGQEAEREEARHEPAQNCAGALW